MRAHVTETLDIDLEAERWVCNRCEADIASAHGNYKEGLLVAEREPTEVHTRRAPADSPYSFAPDASWCRILEFYCPGSACSPRPSTFRRGIRSPVTSSSTSRASGARPGRAHDRCLAARHGTRGPGARERALFTPLVSRLVARLAQLPYDTLVHSPDAAAAAYRDAARLLRLEFVTVGIDPAILAESAGVAVEWTEDGAVPRTAGPLEIDADAAIADGPAATTVAVAERVVQALERTPSLPERCPARSCSHGS